MAASSPDGESLVWNTTPKDPLPTILHWVYCISFVSPVRPSCTFSRITSAGQLASNPGRFKDHGVPLTTEAQPAKRRRSSARGHGGGRVANVTAGDGLVRAGRGVFEAERRIADATRAKTVVGARIGFAEGWNGRSRAGDAAVVRQVEGENGAIEPMHHQ